MMETRYFCSLLSRSKNRCPAAVIKPRVKDWTYYSEVHNFEDPDGESEVDHYEDHEEEDKEVKATFPPAVDPHFIHLRFFSTLDIVPMRALFLGHLQENTKH